MTLEALARGLAINRIAFGASLVALPALAGPTWVGAVAAARPGTRLFARAIGARDVALGLGALMAMGDAQSARRWFQGHAISDGIDFLATAAAGSDLPTGPRLFALGMAGGSTAIALAYARSLAAG